ncbi:hypothetical protein LTR09_003827 [Extremus antarcticus]|uniref:Major facilitator superfamily (MFS) profile domain-containing protein n=1 Tax=Extremus antarcticus TaxID=702011 RepID=A0AAJ0GE06_9PEZI|nr:hypothetical protein LTR09_003827 [Extremus antarcticus]
MNKRYPVEERSVRIAVVLASATASGAFGGCIAYGVGHLNGSAGLEGFRWLFIIEGIITVLSVALVVFLLPDYPARAKFLNDDDKKYVQDRIAVKGGGYTKEHASKHELLQTVCSPRLGFDSIKAQLMTVPPWVLGYFFSLFLGWSADRHNARGLHIFGSSILGAIGWVTAGSLPADAYTARYVMLFFCACGAFPSSGPLSAWVTCNVPAFTTMAIATAMNNSMAGISQIIAQWIWRPT